MSDIVPPRVPFLVICALGLTQIVGYGTLYYSFGTLAPSMAQEFNVPEAWIYGLLSLSLLMGGLVAPISGSLADRFGAARLMTFGSVAAAAALTLCALAPERFSFALGLIAIEVASSFVFYATAFAALAQLAGSGAQRSITHLTLIAGFASTIFWPITATLHQSLSWREVYLIYAALNFLVCVPVHFWLAHHFRRQQASRLTAPPVAIAAISQAQQRLVFGLVITGFALLGFVGSAVLVHMVPMLEQLGLAGGSLIVTTVFGPAQVLSRLINMQFGKGLSQPALTLVAPILLTVALVLLVSSAPSLYGAVLFAILFGMGSGLTSIVSGTLPLVLFGSADYGRRLGWISSARLVVSACAPFAFAVVGAATGVGIALLLTALVGLGAACAFGAIWWLYSATGRRNAA
jgi:MFS family permease